ncbi:hypothetical protein Ccrd_009548, partial [Cynara cardunculus var. scolymus]
MAPRGGVLYDVESRPKYLKYDVEMEKTVKTNTRASNNGLYELLECPVCANLMCLALEKVAESLELPCRYRSLGCHDIFPYYSKLKHEKSCRFRPYKCPYAGSACSITGKIPELVTHLKDDHSVDLHDGSTFDHRYAFNLGMAPFYISFLCFMGEDTEAKKFSYSLEISGGGRKLTWQGVPRSIRDGHQKVRDGLDGLVIPRNLALLFSGGNGEELKLRVIGRIWKQKQ